MEGLSPLERKRAGFERYPVLFVIGLGILVVSLGLMAWRQANEQARLEQLFAGQGPPSSSVAYEAAAQLDLVLTHIIEQQIFLGLAFLKLGIGFSIAVIVLHLWETGQRGLAIFRQAGILPDVTAPTLPWFTRFPVFLLAGFSIVAFFYGLTFLWVYGEYVPLGDPVTTRMTLEAVIKPGKMIGTALLLFGIASGLATIVWTLRMQAHAFPRLAKAAARRQEAQLGDLEPDEGFPRSPFVPLFAGLAVVVSAYLPLAVILAWNRFTNLASSGWASVAAESLEVSLEHWIESYILFGIVLLLTGIGLWLLTILRLLRAQRAGFAEAAADLAGVRAPATAQARYHLATVRGFYALGLGIATASVGLTMVWIFAGLAAVQTGDPSAILADHAWEAFMKPFKFTGLAALFLGIGIALSLIVVNLQMLAMILPGAFARFGEAAQGRRVKPLDLPQVDPARLFPRKLFVWILVGAVLVVTATFPLAWPLRVGTFPLFLTADIEADASAQAALALERFLEHLILPYKLVGVGIILFAIGRYFTTIVGFVRARKAIVLEGAGAIVASQKRPEPTQATPSTGG